MIAVWKVAPPLRVRAVGWVSLARAGGLGSSSPTLEGEGGGGRRKIKMHPIQPHTSLLEKNLVGAFL